MKAKTTSMKNIPPPRVGRKPAKWLISIEKRFSKIKNGQTIQLTFNNSTEAAYMQTRLMYYRNKRKRPITNPLDLRLKDYILAKRGNLIFIYRKPMNESKVCEVY